MKTNTNFDQTLKRIGINRSHGFSYYFKTYIFKDIDLKNKSMLDVGGGNGIAPTLLFRKKHLDVWL